MKNSRLMGKGQKWAKTHEQKLTKNNIKMVVKHMKRCSTAKYWKQSKCPYTENGWINYDASI